MLHIVGLRKKVDYKFEVIPSGRTVSVVKERHRQCNFLPVNALIDRSSLSFAVGYLAALNVGKTGK